jgi:hypothetical protein
LKAFPLNAEPDDADARWSSRGNAGGREDAKFRRAGIGREGECRTGKWLADRHLGSANARVPYRIEGWLAETGTSVWFGAGSTGKTQLMLWMAAMIASQREDRLEHVWLGGRINGTGHVLVLTAEDTREQIVGRLRDVIEHSLGQDGEAALRTCRRIHVMPFLSMTEDEFRHLSPSLFEQSPKERCWEASAVMEEVRRYVRDWNGSHDDPEERIVGVVMDSATSMAGFDSMDAQATTNFFFYLGRLCERLRIFWAIIGQPRAPRAFRPMEERRRVRRGSSDDEFDLVPECLVVPVGSAEELRDRGHVTRDPGLLLLRRLVHFHFPSDRARRGLFRSHPGATSDVPM